MVMTAGIISVVTYLLGMDALAYILLGINIAAYFVLFTFNILRLIFFSPRLRDDLMDHEKGLGFFTLVAGSCMFGSQIYTLTDLVLVPTLLWGGFTLFFGITGICWIP